MEELCCELSRTSARTVRAEMSFTCEEIARFEFTTNNRRDLSPRAHEPTRIDVKEKKKRNIRKLYIVNVETEGVPCVTTIFHFFFLSPAERQCRLVDHDLSVRFIRYVSHGDTNPPFLFGQQRGCGEQFLRYEM